MNPNVTGRVAVVTGASRGLGAGLAVHFAGVGPASRAVRTAPAPAGRPHTADRARPGTSSSAEAPVLAAVDVTDRDAAGPFADAVVERFGRIDLWVNNAGLLGPIGPLAERRSGAEMAQTIDGERDGRRQRDVPSSPPTSARRPGPGVLVNISSGAATKPYVGWAAYCASKAAVDQLTRVVALEEARHGLAAYAVSPGLVDTDMQVAIRAADEARSPKRERFRRAAEEKRFNSPAWVAEHILALAFGPSAGLVTLRIPGPGSTSTSLVRRAGRRPCRGLASPVKVCPWPKSGGRKVVKPVAAAAVTLGTIASIWWFALKPRRKAKGRRESRPPRSRSIAVPVSQVSAGKPSTSAGRHSPIGP